MVLIMETFNTHSTISCLLQYGLIEEMNVCDNMGDHLVGNVYIKVGSDWKCHHAYHQSIARVKNDEINAELNIS